MVFGTTLLLLAKHYFFRDVCVGLQLKRKRMRRKHQSLEIRTRKTTTVIWNIHLNCKSVKLQLQHTLSTLSGIIRVYLFRMEGAGGETSTVTSKKIVHGL